MVKVRRSIIVATAVGAVVLWKVLALVFLLQQDGSGEVSFVVKVLLTSVGLTFLVCGLLVRRYVPGRASSLYLAFCICAGLHWGGPLELPVGQLRTGLILAYVLVSSILSETLFLRFALVFPKEQRFADNTFLVRLLYAPGIAALLFAVVYLVASPGGSVRTATYGLFSALHTLVTNLFPVLALVVFVSWIVRVGISPTQKRFLGLMVGGMLTAWIPGLVASYLGADTDKWNLIVVILPVSCVIAILGIERGGGCES